MYTLTFTIVLGHLLGSTFALEPTNKFEATWGCKQYNTNHGYDHGHPYFATSRFRNIQVTRENVTMLRMGVLGNNDGHVRLAPTGFPYDETEMNEIVLSGWGNSKTVVRRYSRTSPKNRSVELKLKEQSSLGMLSTFEPFMFTMAVNHTDGFVQLTRDGDVHPFLEFRDANISTNYIGFCNWDVPLVFFYDCPLEIDRRVCEGIAFS
uniref:Putative farnesoic acid 0-methyl transferase n=1 Tax=Culex tarsalis TaxID=7177 RepID=A0A1Q3FN29_CULTA